MKVEKSDIFDIGMQPFPSIVLYSSNWPDVTLNTNLHIVILRHSHNIISPCRKRRIRDCVAEELGMEYGTIGLVGYREKVCRMHIVNLRPERREEGMLYGVLARYVPHRA